MDLITIILYALPVVSLVMVIWWAWSKKEAHPTLFGRVWFISLFVMHLLPLVALLLWYYLPYSSYVVDLLFFYFCRGIFYVGYFSITPTILTYIILTIGWVIGRKKWNFHGMWVGFSYLAYLVSYLLERYATLGPLVLLAISIILIVAVWIVYVIAPKKQKSTEQQSVPLPTQPVYYSPAAYLGAQTSTTETAGGHTAVPVEELHQLQALLDGGIITQEEFDAKKKQLLGL